MSMTFKAESQGWDEGLNVANRNGLLILKALGIRQDYAGKAQPQVFLHRLPGVEKIAVPDREDGIVFSHGVSPEQALGYAKALREIAKIALSNEEMVMWG